MLARVQDAVWPEERRIVHQIARTDPPPPRDVCREGMQRLYEAPVRRGRARGPPEPAPPAASIGCDVGMSAA